MKTIKIAHLYYDLMNLYGENGNVLALKKHLENSNLNVEIHFLTIADNIDFNIYDFYYMGMGSENNQELVIKDILKYKEDIKAAIENNKYFIITGNSLEIFGKYIEDNKNIITLNIFDFYTKRTDFRIVGEQVYSTKLFNEKIIGFQNRSGALKNIENNFFEVITGTGYEPKNKFEGFKYKNFYGSYLLGPLLIRNPILCDKILENFCKENNIEYIIDTNFIDYKAYNEFIKNFVN